MTHEWHDEAYERLASANELNLAVIEELRRRLLESQGKLSVLSSVTVQAHWEGKAGELPEVKDGCVCKWCMRERLKLTAPGPFAVLGVDTPAIRGEVPVHPAPSAAVPPGEDPVELAIEEIKAAVYARLELDEAGLDRLAPYGAAGCTGCHTPLDPPAPRRECWYCQELGRARKVAAAGDLRTPCGHSRRDQCPQCLPPSRDHGRLGTGMLAAGFVILACSVHLATMWAALPGLALMIAGIMLIRGRA